MLNDSTAWAAGFERSVYRTSDYGKTWTPYRCGLDPGSDFDDIFFINDTLGYVVGDGIYRTVRPQSAPSIAVRGDTVFCEGGSVTLTAASGFTEYRWSNGATTPVIEARKTGTYFVTVRKGTDCPLVSNSVRVRVLPAPLPGLLSSRTTKHLCFDDSLELRIAGGFRSVRWSTGDSSLAIVVRTAGTYTVTVTDTNGCVGLDSVAITGGTKIVPRVGRTGNIRFCSGDSLVLRAQEGFDTYRWSTNATSPSIVVRTDGSYSVTVTDRYGCVWQSDTVNVTVDTNPIDITGLPGGRLVIDSTRPHALRCDSVRVRNVSTRMLTISTARLLRNIEFSVPQSQL
ncbi:MAG: WD40/YVTN/BNR-like repeat-containing protein, partial [Candidatus Kapaibacterium sp.]